MSEGSDRWNDIWREQKYITDYVMRWYDYLGRLSKSLLPEKKKVLEVGSGAGGGIALFARAGHDAYGIDLSDVAVEKSKKAYPGVSFSKADLFDMRFAGNSFDVVFNSGVIEHFKYPENIRAIKAMERVLKPGGLLIVSVPNSLCLWYRALKKILIATNRWPYGFEDCYSPLRFRKHLNEIPGLQIRRIFGLQVFPMLSSPNFELLPLFLRKGVAQAEKILPYKEYYAYAVAAECIKTR